MQITITVQNGIAPFLDMVNSITNASKRRYAHTRVVQG